MAGPWEKYQNKGDENAVPGISVAPAQSTQPAPEQPSGPWQKYAAQSPVQQAAQTMGPVDTKDQSRPGYLSGTARALGQGITFGLGDEITAAARAAYRRAMQGGTYKDHYNDVLNSERGEIEKFNEDHPFIGTAGEVAGGLPFMFVPGLNGVNGARYLSNAKTAAQAARRSALVGGGYGAVSGFGHGQGDADDGMLEGAIKRGKNALLTGATSAAISGPVGALGYKVGEVVGGVRAAKDEASGPASAYNAIAKSLRSDGLDVDADIIQNMIPSGSRSFTPQQIQEIVTAISGGDDIATIASRYAGKGKGGNVSEATVRDWANRFNEQNTTPMTITDRAKLARPGSGMNTEWRMRAAAATPGEARREASETMMERQLGQGQRIIDSAQSLVGDGSDDSIRKGMLALQKSENAAYDLARASEAPFDLGPTLDVWKNNILTKFGSNTPVGKGLHDAISALHEPTKVPNALGTLHTEVIKPVSGLERFQGAKESFDHLIESSKKDGAPTPLTRQLKFLKDDIMNVVGSANPLWKAANDAYSGAGKKAMEAGGKLAMRTNSKSREILNQFAQYEKMAANKAEPHIAAAGQAQIDLFRQGLSRAIEDAIMNKGATHDLSAQLLLPGSQKILRRVLDGKKADTLIKRLREEQTGTSTFNKLRGGSQTTPLREELDDFNAPAFIESASDLLHPGELAKKLVARGAGKIYGERNGAIMKMMSEMDPAKQLEILEGVKGVASARQAGGVNANRTILAPSSILTGSINYDSTKGPSKRQGEPMTYGRKKYSTGGLAQPVAGIGDNSGFRFDEEQDEPHLGGLSDAELDAFYARYPEELGEPEHFSMPEDNRGARDGYADGGGILPFLKRNPDGWDFDPNNRDLAPDEEDMRGPGLRSRNLGMREQQQSALDSWINPDGVRNPARQVLSDRAGEALNALQFNVPAAVEGWQKFSDDPSPSTFTNAGIETAIAPLSMLPLSRTARLPLDMASKGISQAGQHIGTGAMAGTAAVGIGSAVADDAYGQSAKRSQKSASKSAGDVVTQASPTDDYADLRKQVGEDPKGLALLTQLKVASEKATAAVPGVNSASSDAVRNKASEEKKIIQGQLIERIAELHKSKQPFGVAHESLNSVLPQLGIALPALFGMGRGTAGKMAKNLENSAWRGAVRRGQNEIDALQSGAPWWKPWAKEPSMDRALNHIKAADEFSQAYDKSQKWDGPNTAKFLGNEAVNAVGGAALGAETRALPHQYNRIATPSDSEAHQDADKFFSNPVGNMGGAAAMGALTGLGGGHFKPVPGVRPPVNETKALKDHLNPARASELDALRTNINSGIRASREADTARLTGASDSLQAAPRISADPVPQLSSRGIGDDVQDSGGVGAMAYPASANDEAIRKLGTMGSTVQPRGGLGESLQLPAEIVPSQQAPKSTWHNVRHERGTVIDGRGVGGRFRTADDAEVKAGTMTPNTRAVNGEAMDAIEAWTEKNPDIGTIPNSVFEKVAKSVAKKHGLPDGGAGLVDVMKRRFAP